jgi:flavin reductase (DIM6/NTAB) family NADH-FMN oxidoreductase RutF
MTIMRYGGHMIDPAAFRAALGAVCTPVAVVTSALDGRPHGTTVSAFCSLSLDPPLVLVSLDRGSDLLRMICDARAYGVNVLEHDQRELALGFARKGDDKFADVAWSLDRGLPRLEGVGLWLACSMHELVEGGDHVIVVGRVEAAEHEARRPLLYQRRTFGTLAAA